MALIEEMEGLKLPEGFDWGGWSGDYRAIQHLGENIGYFGGLLVKVTPHGELQETLENELARMLVKHGQVRFRARPNAKPISVQESFRRTMERFPKTMAYLAKH